MVPARAVIVREVRVCVRGQNADGKLQGPEHALLIVVCASGLAFTANSHSVATARDLRATQALCRLVPCSGGATGGRVSAGEYLDVEEKGSQRRRTAKVFSSSSNSSNR